MSLLHVNEIALVCGRGVCYAERGVPCRMQPRKNDTTEELKTRRYKKLKLLNRTCSGSITGALTAVNSQNYVISYKGEETIEGRAVHAYKLKPRKKWDGLFKGRFFLDAVTGRLVRKQGTLVKSPSFFIRKVDFLHPGKRFDVSGPYALPDPSKFTSLPEP